MPMNTTQRIAAALAALMMMSTSANAALLSRAGGQAYYDDVLNITWVADANLAASNTFGVTGINPAGYMTWAKAGEWIAAMNAANYLGVNTWRLPTVSPLNGSSFNYSTSYNGSTDYGYNQSEQGTAYAGATGSEMAHLFYNTLNNKGYCDPVLSTAGSCSGPQAGWGLSNTGPFSNLQPNTYWSGTTYAPFPSDAWGFYFYNGGQYNHGKSSYIYIYAWAVSPGDIAAVPVPGAVWMFGSAVAVMGALRRRVLNRTAA
jgi:hypothetical protein